MREFFLDEKGPGIKFDMFTFPHFLCLGILLLGIILILVNRKKIKNLEETTKKKIKISMIVVWFLNRFLYMGSYIYYGFYSWTKDLPLHFCFVTGYIFMFYLITKKEKLFKLAYFFVFIGPLTATIWPDLKSSFDYFIFYEFFISHHIFFLFVLFTLYMDNIKFRKSDFIDAFIYSNLLFIFAATFNKIFNTNYIMSERLPDHVLNLYPFLNYINYPIIILEFAGLLMFAVSFIPIKLKEK